MKTSVWTVAVIPDEDDQNHEYVEYDVVATSIQDAIRKAIEKHGYGYVISAQRGQEVFT